MEKKGRGTGEKENGGEDERLVGKERKKEMGEKEERGVEERMRAVEAKMGKWEKEERRRNVVIRGMKSMKGDLIWGVEQIWKDIGVEVQMKEVKRIRAGRGEEADMVLVKVRSEKEKEIWERKGKLREGRVWIEEDISWEERKVKWKLRDIAREEREKGRNVWVMNDKIKIEGEWW